jgi:molecular chaperone GrpE
LSINRPGDGDDDAEAAQGLWPEPETGLAEDEPAPAPSLDDALEAPPVDDAAEAFHRRARLAEDRLAEVLGAYRELKQENEAYRERLTKTIQRRFDHRHQALLLKFIDILDNLDRALEAAQTSYAGEPLVEGLILVRTQLLGTLQDEGLERIPVLGLPFDPHVSEAVSTEDVGDPDHHHVVVKELMRGYRIAGKVARASRVVIGEYMGAEAAAAAEAAMAVAMPAPKPPRATPPRAPAPGDGEPTLEEIIARAEALDPPVLDDAPVLDEPLTLDEPPAIEEGLIEEAEPLWHDPSSDDER